MNILSIETSCDETAISLAAIYGDFKKNSCRVLGTMLLSQADKHAEFGGVFPNLAKREHAKNLVPILKAVLDDAGFLDLKSGPQKLNTKDLEEMLEREPELLKQFLTFIPTIEKPDIDAIAVTYGPGLEPALWVGINFARALSHVWNIPIIPINHMEGHVFSSLLQEKNGEHYIPDITFPALALLISGGHTELVLMKNWFSYELVGATRDDAVGEAFDKVARMLGLPYPGGPEISKLAEKARANKEEVVIDLPRPMLHDDSCDFSFSGLKTAVLYRLKEYDLSEKVTQQFAHAFEETVGEILLTKTKRAIDAHGIETLILGGGVSANIHIRNSFKTMIAKEDPEITLFLPPQELTTDNALMIALAGYFRHKAKKVVSSENLLATGNLSLA